MKKGRSEGKRDSEESRKVKCIPWKLLAAPLGRKALAGGQPTPGPSKGEVTWLSNFPCLEPVGKKLLPKTEGGGARREGIKPFVSLFSLGPGLMLSPLISPRAPLRPPLRRGFPWELDEAWDDDRSLALGFQSRE